MSTSLLHRSLPAASLILLASTAAGDPPNPTNVGDVDDDGVVGSGDLGVMLSSWGTCN